MDTWRAFAAAAYFLFFTAHSVHVGARPSQVAQIAFEVWHFCYGFHLFQDTFLASAYNEFSLMGGNGTEGTSSKTTTVQINWEFNHIKRRDTFSLILGMRHTRIRQIKRTIQLSLCHWRIRRIDYYRFVTYILQDAGGFVFIAFLFNEAEVFGLFLFIFQACFMRMKHDIGLFLSVIRRTHGFSLTGYVGCLQNIMWNRKTFCRSRFMGLSDGVRQCLHSLAKFRNRLLAHSIDQ